jgi:hypothetical protein
MKPLPDRATEGRANPKGIPYLYLSTSQETAIAEVRPWLDSLLSVAQFKTVRDLTLVDFCTPCAKRTTYYFEEPGPEGRQKAVWSDIDRAFSEPVTSNDNVADYVPTQILAEFFKMKDFDGIAYRSALGEGYNIALFDLTSADLINCSLYQITGVKFESNEVANPYFIAKHYNKSNSPGV